MYDLYKPELLFFSLKHTLTDSRLQTIKQEFELLKDFLIQSTQNLKILPFETALEVNNIV